MNTLVGGLERKRKIGDQQTIYIWNYCTVYTLVSVVPQKRCSPGAQETNKFISQVKDLEVGSGHFGPRTPWPETKE